MIENDYYNDNENYAPSFSRHMNWDN